MKFRLAETLQRLWLEGPPAGCKASREVTLLKPAEDRILG